MRVVKWIAMVVLCMTLSTMVWAQGFEPSRVGTSTEFWIGLAFSILLALVAGYARGIEKRVSMAEYDNRQLQSQISGLREMVKGDYHPKAEVHGQFDELKSMITALHRRMDFFAAGKGGQPFSEG